MRRTARLMMIALLACLPVGLCAHPHMSISSRCRFVWRDGALAGAYLDWRFDSYFSADIIRGYDSDRNGVFDAAETREVYDNAFSNLKNYHYFVFIRQGSTRSNPAAVSDFSVRQEKGIIQYRFFVDLSRYRGDVYLAVYDYSYFCAIGYPDEDPVTFECDRTVVRPFFEIVENRDYPVYYDPLGPAGDATIYDTWKKGLSTFYPKEIHLSYERVQQ